MLNIKVIREETNKRGALKRNKYFFSGLTTFSVYIGNVSTSPAGIYQPKNNNRNTRARCGICSKLTINISERCHWRRSGVVFFVNFEHISHPVLVLLLLTLNM